MKNKNSKDSTNKNEVFQLIDYTKNLLTNLTNKDICDLDTICKFLPFGVPPFYSNEISRIRNMESHQEVMAHYANTVLDLKNIDKKTYHKYKLLAKLCQKKQSEFEKDGVKLFNAFKTIALSLNAKLGDENSLNELYYYLKDQQVLNNELYEKINKLENSDDTELN